MVITIILFEFQYAAMVERKLAYNDLNQTQAYYLAKSGARVGMLRVALYARLKGNPALKQVPAQMLDQVWQLNLPTFPPDKATLDKLMKAEKDAAEDTLKETKISEGSYTSTIRSESSKINLNALVVPPKEANQRPNFTVPPTRPDMFVGLMLVNLMNGFLADSEDPYKEFPDLRPEEQVMDIMDWVTPGDNRLMGGSKDAYYTALVPPYKAKKGRFFTVDELRLVRGMDGPVFEKLKPHVTVYSYDSKLNINSADSKMYRAIYRDFTDDDIKKILEQKAKIGSWTSEKQFADYVVKTLGRSGFSTLYPDDKNYPFTVGTESFLIESLGVVRKSASSVQRSIKVAVAFSSARGGTRLAGLTQADCAKSPSTQFWNQSTGGCYTNPRTAQECTSLAGTVQQNGSQQICIVPQTTPLPNLTIVMSSSTTKPGGSNTLKVLYWAES